MRQQSALDSFVTGAQTTQERLLRAAASGTFLDEPPEPAPDAPGYRSDSTGKFVGYGIDEHQATRATDTGRITDIGNPEPVSRSTLTARYGPPDGAESLRSDQQRGVSPQVDDEAAAGFGDGAVRAELRETVSGRASAPVNIGDERRDSMVAGGGGGVAFDRNVGGYRETDRVEREVAPPESALAAQDDLVSIEANERAAADAGVLDPEPESNGSTVGDFAAGRDPFDTAENTRSDVFDDGEIDELRGAFNEAQEDFDEIDESDAEDFVDEAVFRKQSLPSIEKGDALVVNTTNAILQSNRGRVDEPVGGDRR